MQPKTDQQRGLARLFGEVANKTSLLAGRATTFAIASAVVIIWGVTGPLCGYSGEKSVRRTGQKAREAADLAVK